MSPIRIRKIIKSDQEQAVASWINYLNQIRIDRLLSELNQEQLNLENALDNLDVVLDEIGEKIINNGKMRGGLKGVHGYIAEAAEYGIGNARRIIEGEVPNYVWIDDNGPNDLIRGAQVIQMKFCNAGNHLSLEALHKHLETYPDYLKNGGIYQIPSDHYAKIKELLAISAEDANKMPTSDGAFSFRQWKEVHDFFEKGDIPLERIEPSIMDYKSVQKGNYLDSFESEKDSLRTRNKERKEQAYEKSKPSINEGIKVAAVSATVEGGAKFCSKVIEKRKTGVKLQDFTEDDWKEILGDTANSTLKGGIRGTSIYLLSNYTATPAAVANALVTASFGVAEQAHKLRTGELDETSFIENCEDICLDASMSALSSLIGQAIIPVPVIGAIIGNTAGMMMYQIAKDSLSKNEKKLIQEYLNEIASTEINRNQSYAKYLKQLEKEIKIYLVLIDKAFAPDVRLAYEGSIQLAREIGVSGDEILDTKDKIYSYFLD